MPCDAKHRANVAEVTVDLEPWGLEGAGDSMKQNVRRLVSRRRTILHVTQPKPIGYLSVLYCIGPGSANTNSNRLPSRERLAFLERAAGIICSYSYRVFISHFFAILHPQ